MSPETVNTSGVVGQATSFDLTLTGGSPYTYTQTFGNICDVSINNDTATVTITPVTSGTLTGSITFDNQATCNITIDVSEPTPTGGFEPSTVTYTMSAQETKNFDFTLLSGSYNIQTEKVVFRHNITGTEGFIGSLIITDRTIYEHDEPTGYEVSIESTNYDDYTYTGNVYAIAQIADIDTDEVLREYTATIKLTIQNYTS